LSSEEEQIKRIYDDILLSTDSISKKKGVRALASYGKKAIHSYKGFVTWKHMRKLRTIRLTL
jgi:hypothetical protein